MIGIKTDSLSDSITITLFTQYCCYETRHVISEILYACQNDPLWGTMPAFDPIPCDTVRMVVIALCPFPWLDLETHNVVLEANRTIKGSHIPSYPIPNT